MGRKRPPKNIRVLIDEIGALNKEIKKRDPQAIKKKKVEELKKYVEENYGADEEGVLTGDEYEAEIPFKDETRSVDIPKLYEVIGHDSFFSIAKVNLKDVDAYLTPEESEKVVRKQRTGSRSIKVVPKEY